MTPRISALKPPRFYVDEECSAHFPCFAIEREYPYLDTDESTQENTLVFLPARFHCDGASIPKRLHSIVGIHDLRLLPAFLHDFLYAHGGDPPEGAVFPPKVFSRAEVDALFFRALRAEGVSWLRARAAYLAVRAFGWVPWRRYLLRRSL